jgi:hypothetical protein
MQFTEWLTICSCIRISTVTKRKEKAHICGWMELYEVLMSNYLHTCHKSSVLQRFVARSLLNLYGHPTENILASHSTRGFHSCKLYATDMDQGRCPLHDSASHWTHYSICVLNACTITILKIQCMSLVIKSYNASVI